MDAGMYARCAYLVDEGFGERTWSNGSSGECTFVG